MRTAIIDVGSNTIKSTVYDIFPNGHKEIFHKTIHAKLSSYIEDSGLCEKGICILAGAVNDLKRTAKNFGCKRKNIFAFATACIRGAQNREEILFRAKKMTKLDIRLLSGEEEAELCLKGMLLSGHFTEYGTLADLGGGSCEFIRYQDAKSLSSVSLNIGALAMYKKFTSGVDMTRSDAEDLIKFLQDRYSKNLTGNFDGEFYVTGGSARAIALLLSRYRKTDFSLPQKITLLDAEELCEGLLSGKLTPLAKQVIPNREETVLPAVIIFAEAAKQMKKDSFTVQNGGARNGFLCEIIQKMENHNGRKNFQKS